MLFLPLSCVFLCCCYYYYLLSCCYSFYLAPFQVILMCSPWFKFHFIFLRKATQNMVHNMWRLCVCFLKEFGICQIWYLCWMFQLKWKQTVHHQQRSLYFMSACVYIFCFMYLSDLFLFGNVRRHHHRRRRLYTSKWSALKFASLRELNGIQWRKLSFKNMKLMFKLKLQWNFKEQSNKQTDRRRNREGQK